MLTSVCVWACTHLWSGRKRKRWGMGRGWIHLNGGKSLNEEKHRLMHIQSWLSGSSTGMSLRWERTQGLFLHSWIQCKYIEDLYSLAPPRLHCKGPQLIPSQTEPTLYSRLLLLSDVPFTAEQAPCLPLCSRLYACVCCSLSEWKRCLKDLAPLLHTCGQRLLANLQSKSTSWFKNHYGLLNWGWMNQWIWLTLVWDIFKNCDNGHDSRIYLLSSSWLSEAVVFTCGLTKKQGLLRKRWKFI